MAAQIFAVLDYLREHPAASIGLLFDVGEEVGGDGMKTFSDSPYNPVDDSGPSYHTVIFGEPTEGKLVAGHKGGFGFKLRALGRAAHSGYPWLGANAISALMPLADYISELGNVPESEGGLPSSPKYGNTTVNLAIINGGVASNVVPKEAEATFMVRLSAGSPDNAKAIVERAVRKFTSSDAYVNAHPNVSIAVEQTPIGLSPVDLDSDIPGFEVITVNYGTDVPSLDIHGRPVKRYLYGPGTIHVAHGDNEGLSVGEIESSVEGYRKILDAVV